MFEAIVTFVGQGELVEDKWTGTYPVTEVHRIEFDTEEKFRAWLDQAPFYAVNAEQLVAKEDNDDPDYVYAKA